MGQVVARDLGLSYSVEEIEKNKRIDAVIQDALRHAKRTRNPKEEEEEDVDEDEEEEGELEGDSSIEESYNEGNNKVISSSEHSQMQSPQNPKIQGDTDQYQRPFQSIQVNKFFAKQNADGEDEDDVEHEQDMLNDMTDEDELEEDNQQDIFQQEKVKRTGHNINDEKSPNENVFENQLFKFQSIYKQDSEQQEDNSQSERQSHYGEFFSSSDTEEDLPTVNAPNRKSKQLLFTRTLSDKNEKCGSFKMKFNLQSSMQSDKSSSPLPSNLKSVSKQESQKIDQYEKYLMDYFPDRLSHQQ